MESISKSGNRVLDKISFKAQKLTPELIQPQQFWKLNPEPNQSPDQEIGSRLQFVSKTGNQFINAADLSRYLLRKRKYSLVHSPVEVQYYWFNHYNN